VLSTQYPPVAYMSPASRSGSNFHYLGVPLTLLDYTKNNMHAAAITTRTSMHNLIIPAFESIKEKRGRLGRRVHYALTTNKPAWR
jgi:hypothetical protein